MKFEDYQDRSLIITAGYGYTPKALQCFLKSSGKFCPNSKVALLVRKQELKYEDSFVSLNRNVSLVKIPDDSMRWVIWGALRSLRAISKKNLEKTVTSIVGACSTIDRAFVTPSLHIALARYFFYRHVLKKFAEAQKILLCDSRDVVFQGNPFGYVGDQLLSGLEDYSIEKCSHNKKWIEVLYGKDGLKRVGQETIICSGVTLGKRKAVLGYLDEMCDEIYNLYPKTAFSNGLDQGIHNWLIRQKTDLLIHLVPNREAPISTIGSSAIGSIGFKEGVGLLDQQSKPIHIIHQYDRKESLTKFYDELWQST